MVIPFQDIRLISYKRYLVLIVALLTIVISQFGLTVLCQSNVGFYTNQFAVQLRPGTSEQDAQQLASTHGFNYKGKVCKFPF